MKARALVLIVIVTLFASLAPSAAYADLYDELDGSYDGEMWRNEVNASSNVGFDSPGSAYASVNLILNDIYQFNADLLARGQSPAAQLAIQLTQLDFIRGAYGRLTQIKTQVENIYLDTAYLRSGMTQVNSYLGGMQYNLSLVKTAAENLDDNIDTILQNQVVIGTGVENIRQNLISVNGNLQDINTGINGTGSTSVRNLLSTIAGNQYAMSNQLRNYFASDVDGNGTEGLIYGLLSDIEEHEHYVHNFFRIGFDNFSSELMNLIDISTEQMIEVSDSVDANTLKLDNILGAIQDFEIENWPSFEPIIDAINNLNNNLVKLVKVFQSTGQTIDGLTSFRSLFAQTFQTYGIVEGTNNPSFRAFIRYIFADSINVNGRASIWSLINGLKTNFDSFSSEMFDYMTSQDGLLKQIRDLLSVSNPDDLVGDFDSIEFDTHVDDLVSRIATVAPFGALLMVSAELDILQSVSAIQNPSFVFPFEFFGQETVTIDLGFMADARPLFNFVVVFGFIYMLLIYSIDFIKEGEL